MYQGMTALAILTGVATVLFSSSTTMASTMAAAARIPLETVDISPDVAPHYRDPFHIPLRPPSQPIQEWPHQSVLLQAGVGTRVLDPDEALPIGVPVDFETAIFQGQFLLRLRNVTSDDPVSSQGYFSNRRRVVQTVIQGRFKKNINMADLYVGCIFRQPMKLVPPPLFMGVLRAFFARIAPGAILDFAAPQPRIITLYAGTAKTLSVDRPGEEPDIAAADLLDDLSRLERRNVQPQRRGRKDNDQAWSTADRQRLLSLPEHASQYEFDTEHVYTMEIYDDAMDYGKYEIQLPFYGKFPLGEAIGSQPMSFTAVTRQGEVLYDFALWHESIVQQQRGILTAIQ
jgi:Protein of unknown function (DUF1769)